MRCYQLLFSYWKSKAEKVNVTPVSELHGCYLQHILNFSDNSGILPKQMLERNVMETGILDKI